MKPEEDSEKEHKLCIECCEDEYYVSCSHEMSKTHYISFVAAVRSDGKEIKKLYPESSADARFKISGIQYFWYYCNRHGLFNVSANSLTQNL